MIMSRARLGLVAAIAVLIIAVFRGTGLGLDTPPEVQRVSVSGDGAEGFGQSTAPSVSDGDRYVAFASDAATLVPGDDNFVRDVFVYDRQTGAVERASVSSEGVEGNDSSGGLVGLPALGTPRVDASARYVVYASEASNLVPGDANESSDIFVRDRVADTTERVSVASDGTAGNDNSIAPDISADGRYVVFSSRADNLVPGDENKTWDVFLHDLDTDVTELISQATDGTKADASSGFTNAGPPRLSADGCYVVFGSVAGNLVAGDDNEHDDIFLRDREAGTTERVSVRTDSGEGNDHSTHGEVSDDGRYVVFSSSADNLIDGDTNVVSDIFLRDRQLDTTVRISAPPAGEANGGSRFPSISADGTHVVFQSSGSNLVPGDTNDASDIFRYDVASGTLERISLPAAGGEADGASQQPDVSADGSVVVFQSTATDLVAEDGNGVSDVFAWGKALFVPQTPTVAPPPTETPTALPCPERGDVTGDGLTNSLDALLVLQFVAGLLAAPDVDRADVNGDGMVSAVDAALMLQYDAGLLECLP